MSLLKSVAAAALLLGLGCAQAAHAQTKVLNLGLVGRLTAPEGVGVVAFTDLVKQRTMENQTHLLVWRALGALPTPMALPEVFTALQQGTVDGQENPIGAIINNKFGQVQKHLTITNHAFTSIAVVMAPAAYNALSADDKKLMVEGARLSMKVSKEQVAVVEKTGIGELRGMGLSVVGSVDTARFQALLKPTYAELAKKFGEAAIARIRDHK